MERSYSEISKPLVESNPSNSESTVSRRDFLKISTAAATAAGLEVVGFNSKNSEVQAATSNIDAETSVEYQEVKTREIINVRVDGVMVDLDVTIEGIYDNATMTEIFDYLKKSIKSETDSNEPLISTDPKHRAKLKLEFQISSSEEVQIINEEATIGRELPADIYDQTIGDSKAGRVPGLRILVREIGDKIRGRGMEIVTFRVDVTQDPKKANRTTAYFVQGREVNDRSGKSTFQDIKVGKKPLPSSKTKGNPDTDMVPVNEKLMTHDALRANAQRIVFEEFARRGMDNIVKGIKNAAADKRKSIETSK